MTKPTKIAFAYRRIPQIDDMTDIVQMLFPGNRNQQHAAARILLALKHAAELTPSLSFIEDDYGISRRTLQRTRAKLSNLGLIEHVSWINTRYGGRDGWRLSSRMSGALRQWAEKIDRWRNNKRPDRASKDSQLVGLLP
jgi:hypothetical protein